MASSRTTVEICHRAVGSVAVLDVTGRMVLTESEIDEMLKDTVVELVEADRRHVVLNVTGVTDVDTSGLMMLISAHLAASRRGAHLILAGPTPKIRTLLGVTRLDTIFEMSDREEDAIARLTGIST